MYNKTSFKLLSFDIISIKKIVEKWFYDRVCLKIIINHIVQILSKLYFCFNMDIIFDLEDDIVLELETYQEKLNDIFKYLINWFSDMDLSENLNLVFVTKEYQRELNKTYRNIDRTTDVLSFPADNDNLFPHEEEELGELYIDPFLTKKQAERHGVTFENELVRLVIHGFLHLIGYDHLTPKERDEMFLIQEEIIERFYGQ